jgi:hypothetical protein
LAAYLAGLPQMPPAGPLYFYQNILCVFITYYKTLQKNILDNLSHRAFVGLPQFFGGSA